MPGYTVSAKIQTELTWSKATNANVIQSEIGIWSEIRATVNSQLNI